MRSSVPISLFLFLLWLAALFACQQSALAEGTSQEPAIIFQAPGLTGAPAISRSDEHGIKTEAIRWNHFVSNDANAMIEYWEAWYELISSMGNVKRIPKFYRFEKDPDKRTFYRSKGTHIEFVGDIKKAKSVYGEVDYVRAIAPSNKNCFFLQKKYKTSRLGTEKKIIRGWYCSPIGQSISDDVIHSAIASLRIRGWKILE